MAKVYQHEYLPLSIYGNVVSLLRDQAIASGVHLDIGCGYGAIAEPVQEELGLTYLGFDLAEDGLESLRKRGFEVHTVDLLQPDQAELIIRNVVGERRIASLTFLDILEHVTNGPAVMTMLRRLADSDAAPLVLSVPNVAHKDLALKLIIGRWDMTEAGLLDSTHVGFYTQKRLSQLMTSVGWRETAARDWLLEHSDQEFPLSAPTLNPRPPLGHFLRRLIDQANPAAIVNQFVRLYKIDKPRALSLLEDRTEPPGPILSVIVAVHRSQIRRLRPLLRRLAEQTHQEFEVVVAVYPRQGISIKVLDPVVAGLPPSFCRRVRSVAQPHDNRVHALNALLADVSGRYVVFLRIGDLVEPNWCATFAQLVGQTSGSVVRVGAVTEQSPAQGGRDEPSQGPPTLVSGELLPILLEMPSSLAQLAMPAGLFRDLGLRFDPDLGTAADWDLVVQATILCGLYSSDTPAVSVGESHSDALEGETALLAKLNAHPLLFPIGTAERLQRVRTREAALLDENTLVQAQNSRLQTDVMTMTVDLRALQVQNCKLQDRATAMTTELTTIKAVNAKLQTDATHIMQSHDEVSARLAAAISILTPPLIRTFVTGQMPALAKKVGLRSEPADSNRPFLSIITRTMGSRSRPLRDVLMCLAGQSSQDFELLIVLHNGNLSTCREVERLIAEFPIELRQRIRFLTSNRSGRAAPLNDAILQAKGEYIAVLDDDDFVLGHWIETFQQLARETPGAVLRAVCARQDFEMNRSANFNRPRALSWFQMPWPANYDAVAHRHANYTPFMSFAFPSTAFHSLGLRFDESLNTQEDWDFQQRVTMLYGIATTSKVTSIYRVWTNGESSSFLHTAEEWTENRKWILDKYDTGPVLLPSGSTSRICQLIDDSYELVRRDGAIGVLEQRNNTLTAQLGELSERNQWMCQRLLSDAVTVPWSDVSPEIAEFSKQVLIKLVSSRSWRWTRPIRRGFQVLRGRRGCGLTIDEIPLSFADRQQMICQVYRSHSWRLMAPLRQIRRMVRKSS